MGKRMVRLRFGLMLTIICLAGVARASRSTRADVPIPQPSMLGDLNQNVTSSSPGPFVVIEDIAYFIATKDNDYEHVELWRTDGSEAGTRLVKDLNPGVYASPPNELIAMNDSFYFLADGGPWSGDDLWRSDGTEAGTTVIYEDLDGYGSDRLVRVKDALFFIVTTVSTWQLWRSEGTTDSTTRLKEVSIGPLVSHYAIGAMGVLGDYLYFSASDEVHGLELWRSDGTVQGTTLLKDIRPGEQSSGPAGYVEAGGKLFFSATDGSDVGIELWRTDGSANGTVLVKDIASTASETNSNPEGLAEIDGKLVFVAQDGIHGRELWVSDGAEPGTVLLKDTLPGEASGVWLIGYVRDPLNDILYMRIPDGDQAKLWRSDATANNTFAIKSLNWSPYDGGLGLTTIDGAVYFQSSDSEHGMELWRSDGTTEGTAQWAEVNPGPDGSYPDSLTPYQGGVILSAYEPVHGAELWWSEGGADTRLVRDIYAATKGSMPVPGLVLNGQLLFSAQENYPLDADLWQTDGTTVPSLFPDLGLGSPGNQDTYPLFVFDRQFFLYHDWQYWRSDGTAAGTVLFLDMAGVPDVPPMPNEGSYHVMTIAGPTIFNGVFYFPVYFGFFADIAYVFDFVGIYRSDGVEVERFDVDFLDVSWLMSDGDSLYIGGYTSETGVELWRSDGTKAGTVLVKDTLPGSPSGNPTPPVVLDDVLYFTAVNDIGGWDVWRSDGSPAGTRLVLGDSPIERSVLSWTLATTDDLLFFIQGEADGTNNLWRSDGTEMGTLKLKHFIPTERFVIGGSATLGKRYYLVADDGEHGWELWSSDGSVANTRLVKDIQPGPGRSAMPFSLTPAWNGNLYFSADDGEHGRELWQSDGTAEGTRLVADIRPGSRGAGPLYLGDVTLPGKSISLFFSADDGAHGRELWVLPYAPLTYHSYLPLAGGVERGSYSAIGAQVWERETTGLGIEGRWSDSARVDEPQEGSRWQKKLLEPVGGP